MIKYIYVIFIIFISSSNQSCTQGKNFCVLCELATDLCKKCESDIFIPDAKGGCEGAKKCIKDYNYCLECSSTNYTCEKCHEDFNYTDNNGGCTNIENCEVSENGLCKICKENYALIYNGHTYLECVSMDTEELLHCEEYDNYGHCLKCKDNYYMNAGDKKCSNTQNCLYSTKGICDMCESDFYLDKSNTTNHLCISNNEQNDFWKCAISNNGLICDECLEPYFLSKVNKRCVVSNYCEVGEKGIGKCYKCLPAYTLTEDKFSCVKSSNCLSGYGYNDKCKICKDGFYNNLINGYCYSNQEDNDQKYCLTFSEQCESCIDNYYLGEDKKCSYSKNCSQSNLGICTKCVDGYYLGKNDSKCTTEEFCIRSNMNYFCEECDEGYFVYHTQCEKDDLHGNTYKHCRIVYTSSLYCSDCKNGFYLDDSDHLCYSNDDTTDELMKCKNAKTNSEGKKECYNCESPYYISEDHKCCMSPGCAKRKSLEICEECMSGWCENHNLKKCQQNEFLDEDEDNKVCYKCKETNLLGTKCDKCEDGYISSNGYCINDNLCDKKDGNKCIQCKQNYKEGESIKSYCLNSQYGCMESLEGCLICNDFYNPNNCSQCFKGFYLDEDYNFCYECLEGCDICTDSMNCGGCKEEGYYIINEASSKDSYDAKCGKCGDGCKICTEDLYCEICFSGYFLNNKNPENYMRCSKCSEWCEECLDENYCLKCIEGYHLILSEDRVICQYKKDSSDELLS